MDGSYTRITFNNYNNQLINNNKATSIEKKPNITVNKIGINSNNIYTSINTNGNASIIKDKNGNIKRKRDFSAKGRQDYFNFNKKYYLKDNNNQNSSGLKKIKNFLFL